MTIFQNLHLCFSQNRLILKDSFFKFYHFFQSEKPEKNSENHACSSHILRLGEKGHLCENRAFMWRFTSSEKKKQGWISHICRLYKKQYVWKILLEQNVIHLWSKALPEPTNTKCKILLFGCVFIPWLLEIKIVSVIPHLHMTPTC